MSRVPIGRNSNASSVSIVTTYTLNSVTPTTISLPYANRTSWSVSLAPGIADVDVAIRQYPAAQDSIFQGEPLTRRTSGNDVIFNLVVRNDPDTPYTGEYSAMTLAGTVDVYVTERFNGADL